MKLHRLAAAVEIPGPIGEVFDFYADFARRPSFIPDFVAAGRPKPGAAGSRIEGPLGSRVHMPVRVTELRTNRLIRYRSSNRRSSSVRWQVRLRSLGPALTRVDEELLLPLALLGRWSSQADS